MPKASRVGMLFVCANNVCRSPLAAAVFCDKAARAGILRRLDVDSAATRGTHAGQRVDPRALAVAARHGYEVRPHRARKVVRADFDRFGFIYAVDEDSLRAVAALRPAAHAGHVGLLLDAAPGLGVHDIPDPYYGSLASFERVIALVELAASALVCELVARLGNVNGP